jgi:hypothetical protein
MTHPTPESLGAYLDGELDSAARTSVDVHLGTCADCSAHLADLAAVDQAAREVPVEAPAGYFEDFAPRVRARLEKRAPVRWRPPVWGWAAAAALLLGVVTPLVLRDRPLGVAQPTTEAPAGAAREMKAAPAQESEPKAKEDSLQDTAAARESLGYAEVRKRNESASELQARLKQQPAPAEAPKPAVAPPPGRYADAPADRRDTRPPPPLMRSQPTLDGDAVGGVSGGSVGGRAASAPPATVAAAVPEATRAQELDKLAVREEAEANAPSKDAAGTTPGFAPPPASASAQRQYGPRGQNTLPAAPPARKAATGKTEYAAEQDEEKEGADQAGRKNADGGLAGTQEAVVVTGEAVGIARGRESAKFRSLSHSQPRTDGEARTLREQWRIFAKENPDRPEADEARVRLVEAGVLAYQLGRKPRDREIALADGREYLERTDAPQAARVRDALKTLEP